MSDYDRDYSQTPNLFGEHASPLLKTYAKDIKSGGRILDIGIGQGRNALPLARSGFQVVGVDSSQVAIDLVSRSAAQDALPLKLRVDTWQGSIFDYPAEDASFDGILIFGLLQVLDREAIGCLIARIHRWSAPGGLVFLTAWQIDAPNYQRISQSYEPLGQHSYRRDDGEIRTFMAKDEVLTLFKGYDVLHHWEGLGPVHQHGDGAPERHGDVELVARKVS
jgi:tellurite methyltransferase